MNGMNETRGRRIYFDSVVYIELIEKNSATTPRLARLFGGWDWQKHIIVTGEITIAEVLVKPIAIAIETDKFDLHDLYVTLLTVQPGVTEIVPITDAVWRRAALVRAQLKRLIDKTIRLPDAVHVAAALESGCDTFVTDDVSLQKAVRAMIERPGMSEADRSPVLKHLITFASAELDALAVELECP